MALDRGKSDGGDAYSASLEAVIRLGFTRTAVTHGLCRIIFSVMCATTPNMRILTQANMENVVSIVISWNEWSVSTYTIEQAVVILKSDSAGLTSTAGTNCVQPTMERIVRYMQDAVCTIANVE